MLTGRLEELANEATEYCKTQSREIAGSMWEEKFAELIIKECIAIMQEQSYNTSMLLCSPPKSAAVWDACNAIEKKFGVK
jgi:hypothetical protein